MKVLNDENHLLNDWLNSIRYWLRILPLGIGVLLNNLVDNRHCSHMEGALLREHPTWEDHYASWKRESNAR